MYRFIPLRMHHVHHICDSRINI